jgi:hypothetical protein
MPRTTNAAGRIRDESLMNLGGRGGESFHFHSQERCYDFNHFNQGFKVSLNHDGDIGSWVHLR